MPDDEHSIDAATAALLGTETVEELDEKAQAEAAGEEGAAEARGEEEGEQQAEGEEGEAAEEQQAEGAEAEQAAEEEVQFAKVSELAEATGMDADTFMQTIKTDVDGTEVSLTDLVTAYRTSGNVQQVQQAVQADQQANQQRLDEYRKYATVLARNFQVLEEREEKKLDSPELVGLRVSDPAEWVAKISEINQNLTEVRNQRQQAGTEYDEYMKQNQQQWLGQQEQVLTRDVPGWNKDKLDAALGVIRGIGFDDNDIQTSGILDARFIKAALQFADMAAELDRLKTNQTKAVAVAKKVKTLPKLVKPGSSANADGTKPTQQTQQTRQRKELMAAKKKLATSGKVEDAAAAIENMGMLGGLLN